MDKSPFSLASLQASYCKRHGGSVHERAGHSLRSGRKNLSLPCSFIRCLINASSPFRKLFLKKLIHPSEKPAHRSIHRLGINAMRDWRRRLHYFYYCYYYVAGSTAHTLSSSQQAVLSCSILIITEPKFENGQFVPPILTFPKVHREHCWARVELVVEYEKLFASPCALWSKRLINLDSNFLPLWRSFFLRTSGQKNNNYSTTQGSYRSWHIMLDVSIC